MSESGGFRDLFSVVNVGKDVEVDSKESNLIHSLKDEIKILLLYNFTR